MCITPHSKYKTQNTTIFCLSENKYILINPHNVSTPNIQCTSYRDYTNITIHWKNRIVKITNELVSTIARMQIII